MMKRTAMDSDVLFLPHEIIRNILKRLPVKSLIRFQCVRKEWKNLIQNPSFVADHLQQSTHQNPPLLSECDENDIPFLLLDSGLQVRRVPNPPSTYSLCDASIVGSCNGLLCLVIRELNRSPHSLLLWNPATTAVRYVPRTRTGIPSFDYCVTGFGFSSIVNDYNIVRTYAEFRSVATKAEVFSLNKGTWKAIDIGNLKGVRLEYETVTANGAIFWFGEKKEAEDKVDVIVSFDIAKEVFTVISRPELDYKANEKLTVYENKLAILCDIAEVEDDDELPYKVDLWVLDEGTCASGQTLSWTKRYTSCPLSCSFDSKTIWRNQIVGKPDFVDKRTRSVLNMMNRSWTKGYTSSSPLSFSIGSTTSRRNKGRRNVLYLMNLTTNEFKRSVIPCRDTILHIYNYVESLVSVGNNYIEEYRL
ncbi:hypothetical protein QN277_009172 [Acacia crassicarpa]|uniref:F-box domain-containing protein n=1 Tax=Acacia crassicarpa TaxID=499986 RepID=A0AAE1IS23_9FABA|nr:hypothetical protein QN277_009172 [Acacia crassicarpa]